MKPLVQFIKEEIVADTRELTKLLVDSVYSKYIDRYNKNQPECVGWLDGHENAVIRFQKIYEAGIGDDDSILDVGCGVAHLHTSLTNKGWNGKYLGIDPNKKAIDLIDENINAVHATVEDIGKNEKWDWVIANGVFNLGLKEDMTFWIIENMIPHARKGIIFNMLLAPYEDDRYEAYSPNWINHKLQKHDHKKIKIVNNYISNSAKSNKKNGEFTVYFYKK